MLGKQPENTQDKSRWSSSISQGEQSADATGVVTNAVWDSRLSELPEVTAVIAVHNVAPYLPDFFRSLHRQRIDATAVEYVFVDDYSTDNSLQMILKWAQGCPNILVYSCSKNGGVAAARNVGYASARGDWVTSVDPDDILAPKYFSQILQGAADFPRADLLTTRVVTFTEKFGLVQFTHPLDFKYRGGNQMVSLSQEPRAIQLGATAVMRRSVLLGNDLSFDTRVKPTFEDAHLISRYLLCCDDPQVALLSSAVYYYRKRQRTDSLVKGAWARPEKYCDELLYGYLPLLEQAKQQGQVVPPWLENLLLYQLFWHFREAMNPHGVNSWIVRQPQLRDHFLELVGQVLAEVSFRALREFSLVQFPAELRACMAVFFAMCRDSDSDPNLHAAQAVIICDEDGHPRQFFSRLQPQSQLTAAVPGKPPRVLEVKSKRRDLFGVLFAYESELPDSLRPEEAVFLSGEAVAFTLHPTVIQNRNGLITPLGAGAVERGESGESGRLGATLLWLRHNLVLLRIRGLNQEILKGYIAAARRQRNKFSRRLRRV